MISSSNTKYVLKFEPDLDPNGLGVIGLSLNPQTSNLTITYHYVNFTSIGTVMESDPLGELTSVTDRITVKSFSISYANTSRSITATATATLAGVVSSLTVTGSATSSNLIGTIRVNDFVFDTTGTIPPGSTVTAVNMATNPRTFTIAFSVTSTVIATSAATLRFARPNTTSSSSLGITLLLDPPRTSTGTFVQTGTSVVVTAASSSHSLITGDTVYLDFSTSGNTVVRPRNAVTSARYTVLVTDLRNFTVNTSSTSTSVTVSLSGNVIIYAGDSSIALTVSGSTTQGAVSFYGQHGPLALDWPVYSEYRWITRNTREDSARDPITQEVDSSLTTSSRAVIGLPDEYFAGFKAVPDLRTNTSISWVVTLDLFSSVTNRTTSVTFSNITQTVLNDWDQFKNQIRNPFVLGGTSEVGGITTYAEPVLRALPAASFTIANTTTAGSGATITVTFTTSHGVSAGAVIFATITSMGTRHSLAQGQFWANTIPTSSSLTYTATSVGSISTTTALLGRLSYVSYER